jgi:hypothetical protein
MKTFKALTLGWILGMAGVSAWAQQAPERTRLYTAPDPASPGGIKGHVTKPEAPIEQILAVLTVNPELVYLGEVSGPKRDQFQFKGLPVGKYDLLVAYDLGFYEGMQLQRDKSTLTPEDLGKIEAIIQKSEPFFLKKSVHRVEGETGRGNLARCICTFLRDKPSDLLLETFEGGSKRPDFRRTYKLVLLKDVGPGWQVVRARDLYPVWMSPRHAVPEHHFSTALSQIRVADQLKDLGDLDLSH